MSRVYLDKVRNQTMVKYTLILLRTISIQYFYIGKKASLIMPNF